MKPTVDTDMLLFSLFWNGVLIIVFGSVFHNFAMQNKYKEYIPIKPSQEKKEVWCEYCGGMYYKGTVTACPHCGAMIPKPEGEQKDEEKDVNLYDSIKSVVERMQ